ncbi:hypothetical protein L3Q82_018985 [Scortum barcoo]|uniref:Uncharacterized protein n=1 Tax=Scortum barcoo TaxID=214431 RepID=A0ACB8VGF9_9TELE|nr:hypothetical protein L3Q82_018985 [Scortum barcoo]
MARTGFCDSKPLLDLHKKADERRAPLRTWANACGPIDHWQPVKVDESRMALVKIETEHITLILTLERRLSTSERIIMGFHEDSQTNSAADGCVEEPVLLHSLGLQGLHSLQALMPSLLRHEVEVALEKLDLIWDQTFAWDVFLDMMRTQTRNSFPNADLPRHFTDTTRAILVDWLIQIHEILHFQEETLYLAIHLLNRSLRQIKVTTANLQLLGMVCLFLAAKKEECLLPEVSGLCYLMDHTYTKNQLLRMERKVLTALKFDLSYCPPLHFLILLASVARCSAKAVWMARYLLELSLLDGRCVVFLPVQLAGAALCLSRQLLQEPPTPEGEAAWCLASSIHVGSSRMPKEQPRSREHSPCTSSSKNAKDTSNSTTLLAIHSTKDTEDSSRRGSRCSSEKDSGYSDGSDWQQTDGEDQRSSKSHSRGSERAEASQPAQNRDVGQGNPGNPALMPGGCELPPAYFVKNMVLKQPDMVQRRGQVSWRNGSREIGHSSAAHMILLQQPRLLPAPIRLHMPSSCKPSVTGKKIKATYLPILNSYPRIAPHPSKKPPDKSPSNDESQNQSKRVCTEHKSDETPVTRSLTEQPRLVVLTSGLPCSSSSRDSVSSGPTTVSSSQVSASGSTRCTTSSFLATRGLHRNSATGSRYRRFLNTAAILKQSGLLDITLRTKELLRQSNATERDIAQLRQHTELLFRAASNPGHSLNGIPAWEQLHQTMAESGCYPDLKVLQNAQISCHPDSVSQPDSISTGDTNGSLAAENSETPPCLLTTVPHSNQNSPVPQEPHSGQGRELEVISESSEKVFMSPDSSTG